MSHILSQLATRYFAAVAGVVAVLGASGCSGSNEPTASTASGGAVSFGGTSVGGSIAVTSGGSTSPGGSVSASGGKNSVSSSGSAGGASSSGGEGNSGGNGPPGGAPNGSGGVITGGAASVAASGGSNVSGGTNGLGGRTNTRSPSVGGSTGGTNVVAGGSSVGGSRGNGGTSSRAGTTFTGGTSGASNTAGTSNSGGATGCSSGPIGTFTGALADGIDFLDTDGKRVNAHGGGIIKEGDTYYMHGEYFLSSTTDNNFNGFSMYSSKDLASWKNEGIILPQQASGELGPNRKGERPHIIKCPSTGEFVLYAHAASEDYQADKEIVYATSATVNGKYAYKGPLTNSSGTKAAHSDMSALTDGNNAYVITESGHVYTLSTDCHSWLSDKSYSAVNGDSGGSESPTVFKAGSTYYWIGSYKTGWRANNNFYSTAPAMTGPWTYQGFIAPVTDTSTTTPTGSPNPPEWISDQRTWLSQSTWVTPVVGCKGTVYVFWGDHWYGNQDTSNPGRHNDQATYVFQPLVFSGTSASMPTYLSTWKLDVGAGTWSQ